MKQLALLVYKAVISSIITHANILLCKDEKEWSGMLSLIDLPSVSDIGEGETRFDLCNELMILEPEKLMREDGVDIGPKSGNFGNVQRRRRAGAVFSSGERTSDVFPEFQRLLILIREHSSSSVLVGNILSVSTKGSSASVFLSDLIDVVRDSTSWFVQQLPFSSNARQDELDSRVLLKSVQDWNLLSLCQTLGTICTVTLPLTDFYARYGLTIDETKDKYGCISRILVGTSRVFFSEDMWRELEADISTRSPYHHQGKLSDSDFERDGPTLDEFGKNDNL